MEYFDFEQASSTFQSQDEDDVASDCPELDESDAIENSHALSSDKDLPLPPAHKDKPSGPVNEQSPVNPDTPVGKDGYPLSFAKEPCDLCRSMGMDCFIAQRGVLMQIGCTCCISLYRECSFTHAKEPGKFFNTLHVVSEDVDVPTGGLTGKRALKSYGGSGIVNNSDHEGRSRKVGARFSREAVRIMKNWLTDHNDHPYPTDKEKDELKTRTGLKRSQISNWLANARRRGKVRPPPLSSSPVNGGINIPGKELPPGVDMSELNPLERWKYSPPEHEPATARDIIQAMASTTFDPTKNPPQHGPVHAYSRKTGSSNDDSSFSNRMKPPSVSSAETSRSSLTDMSFASAFSHRSRGSYDSQEKKERRRRRQKPAIPKNPFQLKSRGARIFQCTFCTDSFATKYDWQRHEKSLHIALDKWTCALQGAVLSLNGVSYCTFCRAKSPDEDHMESHNFSACQEKTILERTFYRKDHLNQHLRLMHNVKFDPWMEHWKSGTTEITSRCGFCSSTFTTWKDRVDHIAMHFKNGTDMSQWKGDWGFEPHIQKLVENSMPPYLIGHDRKTLDPWSASTKASLNPPVTLACDAPSNYPKVINPSDASCFQRVQRLLSSFIARNVEAGIVPTDEMLQSEARIIVYGNDDPWNQTCCDNPVWLGILKRDNGLCDLPDTEHITLQDLGLVPPYAADGGLRQPPPIASDATHMLQSPEPQLQGLQSPGFPTSGSHSLAHSATGSFVGSFTGSFGGSFAGSFAGSHVANPSRPPSSASVEHLSLSAPVSGPQIQTGFPDFGLQNSNIQYNDLDPDRMDGVELNGFDIGGTGLEMGQGAGDSDPFQSAPSSSIPIAPSLPVSAPVTFPMDPPSFIPRNSGPISTPASSSPFDGSASDPFNPSGSNKPTDTPGYETGFFR
ncbi:hypothetical protein FQN54_000145 [Arachnomyces sp. PD_36]|nr:hypothetical protein FQN54_000145 [Arachnomyces sp. PD_36]